MGPSDCVWGLTVVRLWSNFYLIFRVFGVRQWSNFALILLRCMSKLSEDQALLNKHTQDWVATIFRLSVAEKL